MSDQQIRTIETRLEALANRRHIERMVDLLGYVLQGLLLACILWVLTEIVSLKTVAAQLSGQITAAAQVAELTRIAALERMQMLEHQFEARMQRGERHIEAVDERLRRVERVVGAAATGP